MSVSGQTREGVREPVDRRVTRTRASIDDAFIALLTRRGYESVGVSDIVREANVGRATFYEHYTSKDDLLRAQLRRVSQVTLYARGDFIDATALFAHIRDVPLLYRLVAGRSAAARSIRVVQEALQERIAALLFRRHDAVIPLPVPLTPDIAARVVTSNLCTLLTWWADNGMDATPSEMQHLFKVCAGSLLSAGKT